MPRLNKKQKNSSSEIRLLSISDAASFLNVSIDTLRRWDAEGKIKSVRADGKNRYFRVEHLEALKSGKKLSISDASRLLGLSHTTLRRLEQRGLLIPERNRAGEREYDRSKLLSFLDSEYFRGKEVNTEDISKSIKPEQKITKIPNSKPKIPVYSQPKPQAPVFIPTSQPQPEAIPQFIPTPQLEVSPEPNSSNLQEADGDVLVKTQAPRVEVEEPAYTEPKVKEEIFETYPTVHIAPEHIEQGLRPIPITDGIHRMGGATKRRILISTGIAFASFMLLASLISGAIFLAPYKSLNGELGKLAGKSKDVLGLNIGNSKFIYRINVPTSISQNAEFLKGIDVAGIATTSGGIVTLNSDVDAGTGSVFASNLVYSVIAGTGISVSGDTQNPTINNTGVLSLGGKTGAVTLTPGTGITISDTTISNAGVTSLTGTSNQVIVSGSTGSITLTLPQDIDEAASVEFADLTLSTLTTNGGLLYTNGSGLLTQLATQGTTGNCLISNGSGAIPAFGNCQTIDAFWNQSSGALFPNNSTVDLLVGGSATTSADFAVLNVNGSGPATASVSGNLTVMPNNGAGGNVGIGTTSPSSILTTDVNVGTIGTGLQLANALTNATAGRGSQILFTGTSNGNLAAIRGSTATASNNTGKLDFQTSSGGTLTTQMTIDQSGNVGIGTTSPAERFEVTSTTAFPRSIQLSTDSGGGTFITANTAGIARSGSPPYNQSLTIATNGTALGLNYISFAEGANGTYTERMRIEPGGNVGIGNSDPAQLLTVGSAGSAANSFYKIGADTMAVNSSFYSYGYICAGNGSGACTGSGGVVLGAYNSSAHVSIATSGQSLFNGGLESANGLTVGNGTTFTTITLRDDESPSGLKYIHANSNLVGFLTSAGGWSVYSDNSGNWYSNNLYSQALIDSNNNAYYADPNSVSKLAYINTTNDSWFPYNGNNQNYIRGTTNAFTGIWYDENNGAYYIDPNGTSQFLYQYRTYGYNGQEFDANNAGYYLDPDGYSNINGIGISGTSYIEDGNNGFDGFSNLNVCQRSDTNRFEIFSTSTCSASSLRFKHDIDDLDYGLEDIMKLHPVSFVYNLDPTGGGMRTERRIGFISEEMTEVIPEVVSWYNGQVYNIDYENLTALAIKGIQQQQLQIASQSAEIANIKTQLGFTPSGDLNLEQDVDTNFRVVREGRTIDNVGAFSELVVAKVKAGFIDVAEITTESLNIKTENITIGDKTLAQYINENSSGTYNPNLLSEYSTKIATLQSQINDINVVLAASTKSAELIDLQSDIASKEAELMMLTGENFYQSTSSATTSSEGEFEKLRVKNSGLIEGILTVLDTLSAQNLIVNSAATFFGEVVFKDGVRFDSSVFFAKPPVLPKESGGYAVVSKGEKSIEVKFDTPFETKPLVNASLTTEGDLEQDILSQNYKFITKNVTKDGFTIVLNQDAKDDIKFSWNAIVIKE